MLYWWIGWELIAGRARSSPSLVLSFVKSDTLYNRNSLKYDLNVV